MMEFGQDIVVTLVAASAVTVLGRRVFGAVRPAKPGQPACPSCASGAAACAKPRTPQVSPDVQPLTLVRKA